MLLIAASTGLISVLLLGGLTFLRVPDGIHPGLMFLTEDDEKRRILAFSSILLLIPPLLLLHQALRLGAVSRPRRFAALRLAGASPHQVGLLAGLEAGVPALVGATAGALLHRGLAIAWPAFLPVGALPPVQMTGSVIVVIAATGSATGWALALDRSRLTLLAPLPSRPPRPWGALVLLGVAVGFVPWLSLVERSNGVHGELLVYAMIGAVVAAAVSLSSWLGYRAGRVIEGRATSPAVLLAARRLVMEPRAPGRAAAAVGGIAVVAAGVATFFGYTALTGGLDAFDIAAYGAIGITLLAALLLVSLALAIYSVETVLTAGPAPAVLSAAGAPSGLLERSVRYSAAMVAIPTALAGALTGSLPFTVLLALAGSHVSGAVIAVAACCITAIVLCTLAATWAATLLVRPWLHRAADPTRLRTE